MSWTDAELAALKRAYASGTLRVSYDGKSVQYGSASDLLARIRTRRGSLLRGRTPSRQMRAGSSMPVFSAGQRNGCKSAQRKPEKVMQIRSFQIRVPDPEV